MDQAQLDLEIGLGKFHRAKDRFLCSVREARRDGAAAARWLLGITVEIRRLRGLAICTWSL